MLHELEEGTGSRRRPTTRMTKRNLAGPATVTATAAAAAAAEAANSSNIGTSMRRSKSHCLPPCPFQSLSFETSCLEEKRSRNGPKENGRFEIQRASPGEI
ncbi:hypothetical protein V1477_009304 [Vespula maculifrons]|uniref:Uncharacterized protein n=1 Tax=Vespula maculifrons TaxID=7453 RepID=A0ABD2C9F3_VESMC